MTRGKPQYNMRKQKYYYVYIATNNKRHTVIYTGVTSRLSGRSHDHKEKIYKGSFTAKYNINKIVYYETFTDVYVAIKREKQIKAGSRKKKLELINSLNPEWKDLIDEA
jgi:putative endonuclease